MVPEVKLRKETGEQPIDNVTKHIGKNKRYPVDTT